MSLFQKVICVFCLLSWSLNPAFATSPQRSELSFRLMNAQQELMWRTDIIEWEWSRQHWLIAVMDGVCFYLFCRGFFWFVWRGIFFRSITTVLTFFVNTGNPLWTLMHLGFGVHVCTHVCVRCKPSLPCTWTGLSHAWKGRNHEENVELCIAALSADKSIGLLQFLSAFSACR